MAKKLTLNVPGQFQLPKTNITRGIVISGTAKLDVLRLLVVVETQLGRLVEAADDVVQIVVEVRFLQVVWKPSQRRRCKTRSMTHRPRRVAREY